MTEIFDQNSEKKKQLLKTGLIQFETDYVGIVKLSDLDIT